VWGALGDPRVFVEPFFGSGAVLLARPHEPGIETVNDADGLLVHFWRAISLAPAEVARHADYPVSEIDLHARHRELVRRAAEVKAQLEAEPRWFDAELAGWWVWGLSQWIGGGWCAPVRSEQATRPSISHASHGVHRKRPMVAGDNEGRGVHAGTPSSWQQRPHLSTAGTGVHATSPRRPHTGTSNGVHAPPRRHPNLTTAGTGVQRQMSAAYGLGGAGVVAQSLDGSALRVWFEQLAARLRRVRIVCGDFERALTTSTLYVEGAQVAGVFLDPPYSHAMRSTKLYAHDSADVAERARTWAIANGDNPRLRIVLAGLEGEHPMPSGWREVAWKGPAGLGRRSGNRHRERLWLSPHCLADQGPLFERAAS
jgi:hypothetical protein